RVLMFGRPQTYKEVYDSAIRLGSAMRSPGVNLGDRCGIYGPNCPEWITAMEVHILILTLIPFGN
ncbi:eukaryotic long-chain fatty acid CoA synthetase (LC-FACS), partial [Turnera subulata]